MPPSEAQCASRTSHRRWSPRSMLVPHPRTHAWEGLALILGYECCPTMTRSCEIVTILSLRA
jgi:hypothetical protein